MSRRPIRRAMLTLTALGSLWMASCESQIVPPPVSCDGTASFVVDETLQSTSAGLACAFPAKVILIGAHALVPVDPAANVAGFAHLEVTVARLNEAVGFCSGLPCTEDAPQISVTTDQNGLLTYSAAIDLASIGLPASGKFVHATSGAAIESYGAGNSCIIGLDVTLTCLAATSAGFASFIE